MADKSFSLIDLGKISEPLIKLIDTVNNCIGTLYEPTRIRRKAKAKADAALILTKADIERKELLQRAGHRLAAQEMRRQENIDEIVKLASDYLPEKVSKEPVDPDWISRFFDDCKDVSHDELQDLWARLLANEVTQPGACSRKTLAILKDFSYHDALLFKAFCSFIWSTKDDYFFPYQRELPMFALLEKYNISFSDLLHFESLGLLSLNLDLVETIEFEDVINYFDNSHICYFSPSNMRKEIYSIPLSQVGLEIYKISGANPNNEYYLDMILNLFNYYQIQLGCSI